MPVSLTAIAPAAGTVFSVFNGPRDNAARLSGPTYRGSTDVGASGLVGAPDGSLYFVANNRVLRVRPDGALETVAGTGALGFTPAVPSADARTVAIWPTGYAALALDAPRHRLFYTQGCAIYVVDLLSHAMDLYMGNPGFCTNTGDGGLAVAATSYEPGFMTVSETGVLFFVTVGSGAPPRTMRYIDTAGRIATILGTSHGTPALRLGFFLGDVAAIPGASDEVLLAADCETASGTRECILRVDTAGTLTFVAGAVGTDASPEGILATNAVLGDGANLEVLSTGTIVIAEQAYDRVRMIDGAGLIRTIGGTQTMEGDTGDGGPALGALLRDPTWMAVFGADHLAFVQPSARAIRAIW